MALEPLNIEVLSFLLGCLRLRDISVVDLPGYRRVLPVMLPTPQGRAAQFLNISKCRCFK